jgi:hypothetical protein
MKVELTLQEQMHAISEFSEIVGFYIAFEEGDTVKERAESFAKRYPMFTKIREYLLCAESKKESKLNGKEKHEPLTTE